MADVVDSNATSHRLDSERIWAGAGAFAEMEAVSIQSVLSAAGIDAVINGSSQIPSSPFEVLVARENVAQARQVLTDALASGPAGADEAESQTETPK